MIQHATGLIPVLRQMQGPYHQATDFVEPTANWKAKSRGLQDPKKCCVYHRLGNDWFWETQ